jgi:LysM repeat protein
MKKLQASFLFSFLLFAGGHLSAQSSVVRQYIETYKEIAIEEMKRTGIPASITLAQGIHETGAGKSDLVQRSNNHFGIKCKTEWQGERVYHDDDARGECFRKYENPFDSYRDHSDFLKNRPYYASLFTLDPMDYEAWAYGLKKAGYATNPKYPQILIKLIRDYNLQDYTLIAMGEKAPEPGVIWASNSQSKPAVEETKIEDVPAVPKPVYPSGTFRINETLVIFSEKGTSFLALAKEHNISLSRLFEFNDMTETELTGDELVYLQRKRKTGAVEFHTVAPGETVHAIAQAEGIRLESLLELNFMEGGMQPRPGEKIYLRSKAPARPALLGEKPRMQTPPMQVYLVHTVKPKETLYAITKRYAVSQEDVLKWNNLQSPELRPGQQLRISKN